MSILGGILMMIGGIGMILESNKRAKARNEIVRNMEQRDALYQAAMKELREGFYGPNIKKWEDKS